MVHMAYGDYRKCNEGLMACGPNCIGDLVLKGGAGQLEPEAFKIARGPQELPILRTHISNHAVASYPVRPPSTQIVGS